MRLEEKEPPRQYLVGADSSITISDCGSIYLDNDEQITFRGQDGHEYDVAKKNWGYYATPSINCRLKKFKLLTVLTKNRSGQVYIMLVHEERQSLFQEYCDAEGLKVLDWLSEKEGYRET